MVPSHYNVCTFPSFQHTSNTLLYMLDAVGDLMDTEAVV